MSIHRLTSHLDTERIEATKQCYRDVWAYRRVDHIPVFVRITGRLGHTRREIIESDELQYQVNLNNLERSLRILPDDYLPYARVWFGYMTIATRPRSKSDVPNSQSAIGKVRFMFVSIISRAL